MNFNCFIEDDNALLARNGKGCRYFHFPDDILPDFMFDFVFKGRIKIIGGIFNRNLGAVVFEETPKNLSTLCFGDKQVRHQKAFDSDIVAVKVGQKRIITLLPDKFYIHTNIFHSLQQGRLETMPLNPKGIYAYVCSERLPYFACPWPKSAPEKKTARMSAIAVLDGLVEQAADTMSTIAILNIENRQIQVKIAGTEAIAALAFSPSGTRIAAAYESGKEFQIYDSKSGCLMAVCNRGSTEATINSLLFSDCENYLLSTSNKRSVHLFPVLPVPLGHFVVNKAEPFCETLLPEGETGTGSIMAVKSLMNMHEDFERLRVMIITATSHMHLYVIKTVPVTCFLGTALRDTTITFEKTYNLLEVKWPIRRPFIPFDMEGAGGSGGAYDASDASGLPAEDKTTESTV